jgi:hypothetical protein
MKWAINPKTATLRLSSFVGEEAELETHSDWFAKIGLPDSGPAFDKVPRGSVSLDKGRIRILDNAWEDEQQMSPPLTNDQFSALAEKIQARFPGSRLETYRDPATGGWVVNKDTAVKLQASYRVKPDVEHLTVNPEKPEFLFNKTEETIKAVGAKGGRASALARRMRAMEQAEEKQLSDAVYTGPEPGPRETAHEASLKIDQDQPHLKDAFAKTAASRANQAAAAAGGRAGGGSRILSVMVNQRTMTLDEAAAATGIPSRTLYRYLYDKVPRSDWATFDLGTLKGKLPHYDDGGTVASTGLAVVHKGEAVIPQADTLKRSIDALTAAMQGNVGVLRWMVSSVFAGRAAAPTATGGGSVLPPLMAMVQGTVSEMSAPSVGAGWTGSGAGPGGGGPPSVAELAALPHTGPGANPLLASIFGGGTASSGGGGLIGAALNSGRQGTAQGIGGFNPAQVLKNIKSINLGGLTRSPVTPTYGTDAEGSDVQTGTSGGKITGVNGLAGAALMAGGSMLAEQGLLGSSRGTWGGVAEGTAGGAAIGFTMGGPLGAAIGAAAGFGIGVGEKIAGVESPQAEAHRLIKNIYSVDIPTNSGTVKQVVQIAQSQFGGTISVAVRSPSVRQLVMLYSEATGQKMPLSASTPYAGSLVESGSSLYQQASFQNNAWHTYASNLPTLGNLGGTTYPTTPGPNTSAGTGGTYLSLNINGTPITADFVADQSMAAQNASYGRTQQSANLQLPGLMVA